MDKLCFCCVPLEKRQLAISHAQLFYTCHQEGVQQSGLSSTISKEDMMMLLNFIRCNGPRLTRYKKPTRRQDNQ